MAGCLILMGVIMLKLLFVVLSLFSTSVFASELAKEPINVTFLVSTSKENSFWSLVETNMLIAAKQFDIDLKIIYPPVEHGNSFKNKIERLNEIKRVMQAMPEGAYFVTPLIHDKASHILQLAEQYKVNFFSLVNPLPESMSKELGKPRQYYKHWLGEVISDDYHTGGYLAQILMKEAKMSLLANKGLVAVSGRKINTASIKRDSGLLDTMNLDSSFRLKQLVHSNWRKTRAFELTKGLMTRFNDIAIVWCANDGSIATGVISALKDLGRKPNHDILVGGIDWSKDGIELYKQGALTVSLGGQVFSGAILLALIFDYHHGLDFYSQFNGSVNQKLLRLKPHLEVVDQLVNKEQWQKLDYRIYSRYLNPEQKRWNLKSQALLNTF